MTVGLLLPTAILTSTCRLFSQVTGRVWENSGGSYHCAPTSPACRAGSCCWCAAPNATGAFGDRECFMWCKCITTDYISVPQSLAWTFWKSAKPSAKRKGLQLEISEFPLECVFFKKVSP